MIRRQEVSLHSLFYTPYNNLEIKGNYLSFLDKGIYQAVLTSKHDPISMGFFDFSFEHNLYYIMHNSYDYYLSKPSVSLHYKSFDITLEYFYSSDYAIIENSYIVLFRMSF